MEGEIDYKKVNERIKKQRGLDEIGKKKNDEKK